MLQLCGASHEVWSPTAHTGTAGPLIPGLPHPVCSVFRVLHPLDGFLPVRPADCFSSRKRSWGCPLQSFTPHSEAVAPLDARNPLDVHRSANTTVDRKHCRRSPRPRRQTLGQPPAVLRPIVRLQGLLPRWSSFPGMRVFAARQARCSPGVLASPGYCAARTWGMALPPSLLPWASCPAAFPPVI